MDPRRTKDVVVLVNAGMFGSESAFHERLTELGYPYLNVLSNQHFHTKQKVVPWIKNERCLFYRQPKKAENRKAYLSHVARTLRDKAKPRTIVAVLAAEESGVRLADQLADALGVDGNDPKTTDLRRNKFAAQQALKAAGLAHVSSEKVCDRQEVEAALARLRSSRKSCGVVVKPVDASSSLGVHFCKDDVRDVSTAVTRCIGTSMDYFDRDVTVCIIQEHVEGLEYAVIGTCCSGNVKIASMYFFEKIGIQQLSKTSVHPNDCRYPISSMLAYARQCCKVLGMRYGAFNAQFKLRKGTNTPVLIELNARHKGNPSYWYKLHKSVYGSLGNQLDAYLSAMIPHRRKMYWHPLPDVSLMKSSWKEVWLPSNTRRGRIVAKHWEKAKHRIRTFHSFREMQLTRKNIVCGTEDCVHETAGSKVAVVCLMGDSEATLDADEKALRAMLWREVIILEPFDDDDDGH
eukprot:g3340.t1